jgi:glycopeptide antibiotics resistance protein
MPEHQAGSEREKEWSDQRISLWATVAVVSAMIYGSLVPFDFATAGTLTPENWLAQLRFTPWSEMSLTDVAVNAVIGVPLGFFLTGTLRAARRGRRLSDVVTVLAGVGLAALLGLLLEILQGRSTTRMASWNDVIAQVLGAVVGTVAWSGTGARVIRWLRNLATERESAAFTARLLQLYLLMYLLVQVTPFDRFRAAEVAAKYGEGRVTLLPWPSNESIVVFQGFIGNTLLNIPLGAFAVLGWRRRGRPTAVGQAVLVGVSIVVAMAIAQEFMWWHYGGARDLLAGVLGVVFGIAAARQLACPRVTSRLHPRPQPHPWYLVAAAIWTLALAWHYWNPFDFELTSDIVTRRLTRIPLTPFAFYYSYGLYMMSPFQAVHDMLVTALLAMPLGLLLRLAWPVAPDWHLRRVQGIAITLAATSVLVAIEFAQVLLPMRFPDVTDVLIGAFASMVGCAAGTVLAVARRSGWSPCSNPPVAPAP